MYSSNSSSFIYKYSLSIYVFTLYVQIFHVWQSLTQSTCHIKKHSVLGKLNALLIQNMKQTAF